MTTSAEQPYPAQLAAVDQSIASAGAQVDRMVTTMRESLATGRDRSVVIAAMALSIFEATGESEFRFIAKELAVALARLADIEDGKMIR